MKWLLALLLTANASTQAGFDVCKDCTPKVTQTKTIELTCRQLIKGPLCEAVDKKDLKTCTADNALSISWDFFSGCLKGVGLSVVDLTKLAWALTKALAAPIRMIGKEYREEKMEAMDEHFNSVHLYLHTEYQKGARNMLSSFGNTIYQALRDLVSDFYADMACYNNKKQSEVLCRLAGDFLIPPAGLIALIKRGKSAALQHANIAKAIDQLPKAKASTQRLPVPAGREMTQGERLAKAEELVGPLSAPQRQALMQAHEVGAGRLGRDGTPAQVGNYTFGQLREKSRILQEAGLSRSQVRALMENEVVGARGIRASLEPPPFFETPATRASERGLFNAEAATRQADLLDPTGLLRAETGIRSVGQIRSFRQSVAEAGMGPLARQSRAPPGSLTKPLQLDEKTGRITGQLDGLDVAKLIPQTSANQWTTRTFREGTVTKPTHEKGFKYSFQAKEHGQSYSYVIHGHSPDLTLPTKLSAEQLKTSNSARGWTLRIERRAEGSTQSEYLLGDGRWARITRDNEFLVNASHLPVRPIRIEDFLH